MANGTYSYRLALKQALMGAFGSALGLDPLQGGPGATNQQAQAEIAFAAGRRRAFALVTDAGTAATVMAETPFLWADSWLTGLSSGNVAGLNLVGVEFVPQLTVSVAATNFYTLTVNQRTSGGTATVLCSMTSNTGGTATTAFTAVAMPTSVTFPVAIATSTDILTVKLTKTGSGAAISSATGFCLVQAWFDEV